MHPSPRPPNWKTITPYFLILLFKGPFTYRKGTSLVSSADSVCMICKVIRAIAARQGGSFASLCIHQRPDPIWALAVMHQAYTPFRSSVPHVRYVPSDLLYTYFIAHLMIP